MEPCTIGNTDGRSYKHVKSCGACRAAWPLIATVLDTMTPDEVASATEIDVIEKGFALL